MDKHQFDKRIEIACFRIITNMLRERSLITRTEFKKIHNELKQIETDLIAAKPSKTEHSRDTTMVD